MAVKSKKKTTAAAKAKKKKTVSKKPTKSRMKKGSRYQCSVCGIAVTVDEVCGCVDVCDIICCGEQMKAKRK